jgi:tRNA1Val (adenine37-N6)-methyltransferase
MTVTLDGIRDIKLYQNQDGYRFSVDAVLLYAFVSVKHAKNIIDLGAGSGVIGLLLAKKYTRSSVLLVELQKSLFSIAQKNIRLNALENRVSALLSDIRKLKKDLPMGSYDVVVANPPFRRPKSGRISVGEEKAVARHELKVNLSAFAESSAYLLRTRGRFYLIFHPERILEVVDTLRIHHLEPKRLRFVHNNMGAESKIMLVEAVKGGRQGIKIEKPLYIYDSTGLYTEEVREIYGYQRYG